MSLLQVPGVPPPLVKAIIQSLRTGVVHRWSTLITWFITGYGLRHAPWRDRDCLLLRLQQQWTPGHAVVQCGRGGCNGAGCRYNWQICTRHNSVNNSVRNCWSAPATLCWAISYTGEEPLAHFTIWADAGSHPGSYRWLVCRGLCTTPRRCFPILTDSHTSLTYAQRACEHLWKEQGVLGKIFQFWCSLGMPRLSSLQWNLYMKVWAETCTGMSICSSFCSADSLTILLFLLAQGADNAPTAVLLPSYGPHHLSWYIDLSPGIFSMLLTLCWDTGSLLYMVNMRMLSAGAGRVHFLPL